MLSFETADFVAEIFDFIEGWLFLKLALHVLVNATARTALLTFFAFTSLNVVYHGFHYVKELFFAEGDKGKLFRWLEKIDKWFIFKG